MAIAMLIVGSGLALLLRGQQRQEQGHRSCHRAHAGSTQWRLAKPYGRRDVLIEPAGKRLVSRVIDYSGLGPHRHARSAFIYAYVLRARSEPGR